MSIRKEISPGCITALVTPFRQDGSIDWSGLEQNIGFQLNQGVAGELAVGTSGESPTLFPDEHIEVVGVVSLGVRGRNFVIGGGGSNSTKEALAYVGEIEKLCGAALLVDPYYNGPSSLEIRKEYYGVIAERFPETTIVPYPIPGRTGCLISAQDLALLSRRYPNIKAVKEATGDWDKLIQSRMSLLRRYAPKDFLIFSGDDDKTFAMMTDQEIRANGVISVMSNIAPAAVQRMCQKVLGGYLKEAGNIRVALNPLFGLVTVSYPRREKIFHQGEVMDKFRNPLPIKTIMNGLGMPAGPCRQPLGKMTTGAVETVRGVLRQVWQENAWVLKPIEDFYGVNISARLADDKIWERLSY